MCLRSLRLIWRPGLKLRLHCAIYRLRFYSNSLIHILSLSNSHNNVESLQKNRGDKSHCVIVALSNQTPLYLHGQLVLFQFQLKDFFVILIVNLSPVKN